MDAKLNQFAKVDDFERALILAQYAHELNFRAFTGPELYQFIKARIDLTGLSNTAGLPEEFPEPNTTLGATNAQEWTVLGPGTYNKIVTGEIVIADDEFAFAQFDGTDFNRVLRVKVPQDPNTVKKVDIDISGGVAGFDRVNEVTSQSRNYADTSKLEAGYVSSNNGGYQATNNWIRIPYTKIPDDIKGKTVTAGPFGNVPSTGCAVSFRDLENNWMQDESIVGEGSGTPTFLTFVVPITADRWGFVPVNDPSDGGIGTRPHDNIYVNSFMVNEGAEPLPYEPGGVSVKAVKIDKPNDIPFSNEITETGSGAVPASKIFAIKENVDSITVASKNLIDTSKDVVRGYWNLSGVHNNSINWIKTLPKRLPKSILDKLANEERVFIAADKGGSVPSSGGSALVLWNEANEIIETVQGNGTGTYPLVRELPANAVNFAFTIGNQPSNGGIGGRPLDNDFTNSFMVNEGAEPLPYEPGGRYINPKKIPGSNASRYDTNEIVLKKISNTRASIYFHIGGENNKWFRIDIRRATNLDRFIDVWRLDEGWITLRNGDSSFLDVRQTILTGVYENAIYLDPSEPYNNALGSSHGWEMLTNYGLVLFMDGKHIDLDNMTTHIKGRYLTFHTLTDFKTADGSANVGHSFKKWIFRNGIFRIQNNIDWLEPLQLRVGNLNGAFVSMCSVKRSDDIGNITHSAMSNEDGKIYDVSTPGFTTPIQSDFQNPKRNQIILWGDEFKAELTMIKKKVTLADGTILPYGYSNSGMYVKNTSDPNYNKIYGTMGGTEVNPGDFWEVETEYKLSNTIN